MYVHRLLQSDLTHDASIIPEVYKRCMKYFRNTRVTPVLQSTSHILTTDMSMLAVERIVWLNWLVNKCNKLHDYHHKHKHHECKNLFIKTENKAIQSTNTSGIINKDVIFFIFMGDAQVKGQTHYHHI